MRRARRALFSALLVLSPLWAQAEEWRDVVDDDGIVVSTLERPDSELPLLRGVTTIAAGPVAIADVIRDVPRQSEWMHQVSEARVVEETDEAVFVYTRTDMPWPVADRDAILRTELIVVEPDVEVRAVARSTDAHSVPELNGVVRMPRVVGEFHLRIAGEGRTRVEYRLDVDPGGRVPKWLVKRVSRDNPFYTLRNLRQRVGASQD